MSEWTHPEAVQGRDLDASPGVGRLARDAQALVEPDNAPAAKSTVLGHVTSVQAAVPQVVLVAAARLVEERLVGRRGLVVALGANGDR